MIVYWILLLIIAFVAYNCGSISTLSLASVYVFHRDLHRIGKKSMFYSNFKRLYGYVGFLKLLGVELLRDLIPILFGGLLLALKGHADVGRAFAGFCLVWGRLFPVYNHFRGSHASICLIVSMLCVNVSLGVITAVFVLAGTILTRYLAVGALAGSFIAIVVSILVVDGNLMRILCILTAAMVLIRHIPAIQRIAQKKELRMSLEEDISYKFEELFH